MTFHISKLWSKMNVRVSPIYATLNYKYQSQYAKVQRYVIYGISVFCCNSGSGQQVGGFGLFWSEELQNILFIIEREVSVLIRIYLNWSTYSRRVYSSSSARSYCRMLGQKLSIVPAIQVYIVEHLLFSISIA